MGSKDSKFKPLWKCIRRCEPASLKAKASFRGSSDLPDKQDMTVNPPISPFPSLCPEVSSSVQQNMELKCQLLSVSRWLFQMLVSQSTLAFAQPTLRRHHRQAVLREPRHPKQGNLMVSLRLPGTSITWCGYVIFTFPSCLDPEHDSCPRLPPWFLKAGQTGET